MAREYSLSMHLYCCFESAEISLIDSSSQDSRRDGNTHQTSLHKACTEK